ncbi:hypothetical protein bsdcttw_39490 [Anaerocolumna chitinilytica]|uniref:Uncharacterized protein n=1 Tax=Anaerocolumna chitinilytica TaxID=1727145 RepID=A0A7I8DR66_9FIRM|nr:hypothetical protein bsdcttw_39490 [Anaerocolumna chitinilytica]
MKFVGTDDEEGECLGALLFVNPYSTKTAKNVADSHTSAKLAVHLWLCKLSVLKQWHWCS